MVKRIRGLDEVQGATGATGATGAKGLGVVRFTLSLGVPWVTSFRAKAKRDEQNILISLYEGYTALRLHILFFSF